MVPPWSIRPLLEGSVLLWGCHLGRGGPFLFDRGTVGRVFEEYGKFSLEVAREKVHIAHERQKHRSTLCDKLMVAKAFPVECMYAGKTCSWWCHWPSSCILEGAKGGNLMLSMKHMVDGGHSLFLRGRLK